MTDEKLGTVSTIFQARTRKEASDVETEAEMRVLPGAQTSGQPSDRRRRAWL